MNQRRPLLVSWTNYEQPEVHGSAWQLLPRSMVCWGQSQTSDGSPLCTTTWDTAV